jgi:hypothetical protein
MPALWQLSPTNKKKPEILSAMLNISGSSGRYHTYPIGFYNYNISNCIVNELTKVNSG